MSLIPASVSQEHVVGAQRAHEGLGTQKNALRSLLSNMLPYMKREAPREGHAHLALALSPAHSAPHDASSHAAAPAQA